MHTIEEARRAFAAGEFVVIVDDQSRENEGDLVCAAELITPEMVAFIAREARGLLCLAMTNEEADRLALPPMAAHNTSHHQTNFTVSIDAAQGVSTGISAADRAHTIRLASSTASRSTDFSRPGHIFPLRAAPGGVCERDGHTEAAVDLARLAGLRPLAAICEVTNDDGTMARLPQLTRFAAHHSLPLISVAQIREFRLRHETLVSPRASSNVPTIHGPLRVQSFVTAFGGEDALAFIVGSPNTRKTPLVRVHSECLTGESIGSLKCDCGHQLQSALALMQHEGAGVVVYLRQEGRGIGIHNKLRAYALQEKGLDTIEANLALGLPVDQRDYAVAAHILRHLEVSTVRLITNNPDKVRGLAQYGVRVAEQIAIPPLITPENTRYLTTKKERLGHSLRLA